MTDNETKWLVEKLKAMADPNRLLILKALGRTGLCSCLQVSPQSDGLCNCDVEEITGLAQPTVSHHLNLLKRAGLIKAKKLGRWVYYQRDPEAITRLGTGLMKVLLDV